MVRQDGVTPVPLGFRYADVPSWATVLEVAPDPAVVFDASVRAAIRETGWAWRIRDNVSQIEMVLVPPGSFSMGCAGSTPNCGCPSDELPTHQVLLAAPFYLGRYEVTQSQWQARMGQNPSAFSVATSQVPPALVPSRPVETVSWDMIAGSGGFLERTGLRLPT